MTPYQAVIATAELLEESPDAFCFMTMRLPSGDKSDHACLLGWIAFFLGLDENTVPHGPKDPKGPPWLQRAAELINQVTESQFYDTMYQVTEQLGHHKHSWKYDARVAAKSLRHFATELLGDEVIQFGHRWRYWNRPPDILRRYCVRCGKSQIQGLGRWWTELFVTESPGDPVAEHPDHCLCDGRVTLDNMDERIARSDQVTSLDDVVVNEPCIDCGRDDLPLHIDRRCPECAQPHD